MSVRSDTPTSFFLVLSKAAFRTWGFPPPLLAACALLVSFLRPARFVTACQGSALAKDQDLRVKEQSSYHGGFLWASQFSCGRDCCGIRAESFEKLWNGH